MADDPANYTYADIPVEARVFSSQQATPEKIVGIAEEIWKKIGASGVDKDDDKGNDALLARLQDEYSDFNKSFPIILRWMVQMRQFRSEALRKYLLMHASAKLDTREGFLELQADYLVLLYRETHRHPDEGFVKKYRESLITQLIAEDKAFMDMQKEVEAELAAKAKLIDAERRQRLYEYLMAQRVATEKGIPGAPPRGGQGAPPCGPTSNGPKRPDETPD